MLIYEPKKYPDLNPKIGDTVYDWISGEELGRIHDIGGWFMDVIYCDPKSEFVPPDIESYFCSGFYYDFISSGLTANAIVYQFGNDILMFYLINRNDRIKC